MQEEPTAMRALNLRISELEGHIKRLDEDKTQLQAQNTELVKQQKSHVDGQNAAMALKIAELEKQLQAKTAENEEIKQAQATSKAAE